MSFLDKIKSWFKKDGSETETTNKDNKKESK